MAAMARDAGHPGHAGLGGGRAGQGGQPGRGRPHSAVGPVVVATITRPGGHQGHDHAGGGPAHHPGPMRSRVGPIASAGGRGRAARHGSAGARLRRVAPQAVVGRDPAPQSAAVGSSPHSSSGSCSRCALVLSVHGQRLVRAGTGLVRRVRRTRLVPADAHLLLSPHRRAPGPTMTGWLGTWRSTSARRTPSSTPRAGGSSSTSRRSSPSTPGPTKSWPWATKPGR